MNKKIIMSLLSVTAALTLMGGSAFAAFATSADLKANTFATTDPHLLVSNDDVPANFGGQVVSAINETGIIPGGTPVVHHFFLENTDPDTTADLNLTGQFTITNGGSPLSDDLSIVIQCGANSPVTQTVANWASTAQNLGTIAHATDGSNPTVLDCTMAASLPALNNTDAGQTLKFDAVFGGSTL